MTSRDAPTPSGPLRGILLDLNGVFYDDNELLPGAADALADIRKRKLPCRFTTNTTTLNQQAIVQRLQGMGLSVEPSEILSPVAAAVLYLKSLGKPRCHLILREELKGEFADFESAHTNPDVVVVGDIGDRWNYAIMNQLFHMLMYGARLVALHRGRYWQAESDLRIDIGAFVAGLEYATGHQATVIGKPSESFFAMALASLNLPAGQVLMVGDDIDNDVGGAQAAGIPGVLVKTGKYRPEASARSRVKPHRVLDSIANLPQLLEELDTAP